jgi:hypothetical protein
MSGIPKISNPFEDETDFIDSTDAAELAKHASQQAATVVTKQVVKPAANQLNPDQDIVDFLYGATAAPSSQDSEAALGGQAAPDAGIEQISQHPQQAAKTQQIIDPDQQMTKSEKAQYSEEQLEEREKARLHQRNYFTMGNKLDDIGFLEEQVARVRQQKEQEEQEKKQEEEEEEERKKQEEEEQKQQLEQPTGKKTGVAPAVLKREQNKAENKTGFSG